MGPSRGFSGAPGCLLSQYQFCRKCHVSALRSFRGRRRTVSAPIFFRYDPVSPKRFLWVRLARAFECRLGKIRHLGITQGKEKGRHSYYPPLPQLLQLCMLHAEVMPVNRLIVVAQGRRAPPNLTRRLRKFGDDADPFYGAAQLQVFPFGMYLPRNPAGNPLSGRRIWSGRPTRAK